MQLTRSFASVLAVAAGLRAPSQTSSGAARLPWRTSIVKLADVGNGERLAQEQGKRGFLGRFSRRVKEKELPEIEEIDLAGISRDVDAAIATRRRRLNVKLGQSLKTMKEEVLDEVELQANSAKERRNRIKDRQEGMKDSLAGLRDDLLDEVTAGLEDGLLGVQRGGKTLEKALKELRRAWEDEVNELVNEAKSDVDTAVADIEQVIEEQKDEWRASISKFDTLWLSEGKRPRFNSSALSLGEGGDFGELPSISRVLPKGEIDARVAELQQSIALISKEVESDLKLFKSRWGATTDKLEALPANLTRITSLAAARMYVADTVFAGDVPALLTSRGAAYQNVTRRMLKTVSLDRPTVSAPASGALGGAPSEAAGTEEASNPVLRPTVASNLRLPARQIAIVTTAALPWMTGTSINPLLRAAYLSKSGYNITLLVPWLKEEQQSILFPSGLTFKRPALQEQYIRWWLETRSNVLAPNLRVRWYPAIWSPLLGCIIQDIDDITHIVPEAERDVVILEEPEHLNWYHHGRRWTDVYRHVVGIAHTNYLQYARFDNNGVVKSGIAKEAFTKVMNDIVCGAYTDVVVKLSATLPDVPANNLVCNVHGVRAEFLAIGAAITERDAGAYFLGKAMYTKGYREMIDALNNYRSNGAGDGERIPLPDIDTYGSGVDYDDIVAEIDACGLPITPHAAIDHAHPAMHGYRVFVNPSTSDVLCTATAEALAMGKKVVIPDHPSNTFFKQFTNTYMYSDPAELVPLLAEALAEEPTPMAPMEVYALSWEAASERLLDAAALPAGTKRTCDTAASTLAYYTHYAMGVQPVFDVFRTVTGAGPKVPWSERFDRRALKVGGERASRGMSGATGSGQSSGDEREKS